MYKLMNHLRIIFLIILFFAANNTSANPSDWGELTLEAEDGVIVYGYTLPASQDPTRPIILLFHQAGTDARGEYARIAPRLVENQCWVANRNPFSGNSLFPPSSSGRLAR